MTKLSVAQVAMLTDVAKWNGGYAPQGVGKARTLAALIDFGLVRFADLAGGYRASSGRLTVAGETECTGRGIEFRAS